MPVMNKRKIMMAIIRIIVSGSTTPFIVFILF
jgi:hypothetical protein